MMPIPFIQVYKSYRIKTNLIYLQNEKKSCVYFVCFALFCTHVGRCGQYYVHLVFMSISS